MKKLSLIIVPILLLVFLVSCNIGETIEGFKPNEIIVVRLDIEDDIEIEKIILYSNYGTDSILKNEIGERRTINLKTPQKGEGLFSICVFTSANHLCSEQSYVEGGYRPTIKLKNGEFEFVKWF